MKNMLIIPAAQDVSCYELCRVSSCACELDVCPEFGNMSSLTMAACPFPCQHFDYVYLCAHGARSGFGDREDGLYYEWSTLGHRLEFSGCLKRGANLLLACCECGLEEVAATLFNSCESIGGVCGPDCPLTANILTVALEVFLTNLEASKADPCTASWRASQAVGVDFRFHYKCTCDPGLASFLLDPNCGTAYPIVGGTGCFC